MLLGDMVPPAQGATIQQDAHPEAPFDEAATLAATLCRTAQAVVVLLEADRRWYRASGALRLGEAPPNHVLCYLIASLHGTVVFEDTHHDDRLLSSPLLQPTSLPRFIAASPILRPSGELAGLLLVSDGQPRALTSDQEHALDLLARQLARHLDLLDYQHAYHELHNRHEAALTHRQISEELFRTFMDASPFLSFLKDAAGRLLFYNRSYARHFGIGENTWLGRSDEQLWSRSSTRTRISDMEVMAGDRMVASEEQLGSADGTTTHWKTYRFPCLDGLGNHLLAGLAMDISEDTERKQELERFQLEMQQANEQLRRLSVTDELTRLRNRRAFEERLVVEFSMARRRRRELAVLLLDIDNFKKINDRWGHDAGDVVLRKLSNILRTTLRLPDLVARYGGEEFVILLPESGIEAGRGFARRLMARMAAEPWDNEPVTLSIGLAILDDTLFNGFQLVSMADEALYAAKRQGKNRLVTYGEHQDSSPTEQLG